MVENTNIISRQENNYKYKTIFATIKILMNLKICHCKNIYIYYVKNNDNTTSGTTVHYVRKLTFKI